MKKYKCPELDIVTVTNEDIIAASFIDDMLEDISTKPLTGEIFS